MRPNISKYDSTFFAYVNSGALRSAQTIIRLLTQELTVGSVLDVGCGHGAWLSVWQKLGTEIVGVDGHYVDPAQLLIPKGTFVAHDLKQELDLRRRFDLVQSLEVAEHLPEAVAAQFVSSLVRHGDLVLFSAATKGQGGNHHINEQDHDYWRALFTKHHYVALDYVRPLIVKNYEIESWYRYNTLLYVSLERFERLPPAMRRARVPAGEPLRDPSPLLYRFRKALTILLPVRIVTTVAKIKERLVARIRSGQQTEE